MIQRIINLVGNLPLYWRVFGIKGMMTWALIRYGASDYRISHIEILTIDIEGAEKEVFKSSDPWINRASTIIIELHERVKPGTIKAFFAGSRGMEKILERGYLIVRQRTV